MAAHPPENSLSILTYNVMLLPPFVVPAAQAERAALIPPAIAGSGAYDAVVFNEAFDDGARQILQRGMAQGGYVHATPVVSGGGRLANGGIFVVGRHPIDDVRTVVYKESRGSDGLAAKGAVSVRFVKDGQTIHLIATHLQADRGAAERTVRQAQLRQLFAFLADRTMDARAEGGLVLVAGDLNICALQDADELAGALRILNAELVADRPACYTSDPSTNTLGRRRYPGVAPEWLDYVLVNRRGVGLTSGTFAVHRFQAPYDIDGDPQRDLSDHYALAAHVTMRKDLGTGKGSDEDEALI